MFRHVPSHPSRSMPRTSLFRPFASALMTGSGRLLTISTVQRGGAVPVVANVNPTVRRRRLGSELRKLREQKGMTAEEVAARLLVSQSKISRLENGRRSISQRDVRDLCGVYGVEDLADRRLADADGQGVPPAGLVARLRRHPVQRVHRAGDRGGEPARLRTPGGAGPVADPGVRGGDDHRQPAGGHPGAGRQAGERADAPPGADHRPRRAAADVGGHRRGGAVPEGRRRAGDARTAHAPGRA